MAGMGGGSGGGGGLDGLMNIAGGIGAIVTTVAGVVEASQKMKEAKAQAKKAEDLRRSAKYVAKENLRPEFKQVQDAQTIASTYGLNNRNRYEQSIDNQVANMNRDATAIGSSGGASLAALSGAYNKGLDAYNNLAMKDSEIQQGKLNQLYQTTWNVGDEQRKLEQEQTRKKENILAQAAALDAAATANRMNAHETAAGATMQGAAMYAGSAMPTKNQSQVQQQTYQMPVNSNTQIPQQQVQNQGNFNKVEQLPMATNYRTQDNTYYGGNTINTKPNNYSTWGSW